MREVTVTQVLKRLQDFGNIPENVLKNKGLIGKDVHSAIEASIKGDWYPLEEERRIAYFASYGKWMGIRTYSYCITEQRYWDNDLCLSGQIDAVVRDIYSGHRFLLDFKTSANESFSKDGMSIWSMQAHLYYHLLCMNDIEVSKGFMFLQLRTKKTKDGHLGIEPKEFIYPYDQKVMDRCLEEVHKYWEEFDEAKVVN